jgi:hypothetical protein
MQSRGGAVGKATEGSGFESRYGQEFSLHVVQNGPTQPPIEWVLGAPSTGVKRQGRETDRLPSTTTEIKKTSILLFIRIFQNLFYLGIPERWGQTVS